MLKPWLIFVREHGNSERIIDVLVVVKLAITSTAKKVSQAYECSLPESDARASFSSICYVFIFSLDCSFFMGIEKLSINYDYLHLVANMSCEESQVQMWEWRFKFIFFFEQPGWWPPGSWCPTQTAYSAYRDIGY